MMTQTFEDLNDNYPIDEPIADDLDFEVAADIYRRLSASDVLSDDQDVYRSQLHNLMFEYYIERVARDEHLEWSV